MAYNDVAYNTALPTGPFEAMQDRNFFLWTKLLPPRAVTELLQRPRLTKKLQANLGSPITMVAADAGCGPAQAGVVRRLNR